MFKIPETRLEFWLKKIGENRKRDKRTFRELRQDGWRIATVWECSLRGKDKRPPEEIARLCHAFLRGKGSDVEISGRWDLL